VLKQGLNKIKSCRPRSAPRRHAAMPRPRPSASAPMRRPRPPPAEAAHHPSCAPFLGRHAPHDARSPCHATRRCVIRTVLARLAPLGPAVRRSLPSLVRRTTAGAVTSSSPPVGPPLFKVARPSSSRPAPLPPLHRARHGRCLASRRLARPLGHRAREHLPKDP
jgi:hypothetical protein